MASLTIASKANQAITVPVLLVAHYAKESEPSVSLNTSFEDVDILTSNDGAVLELTLQNNAPVYAADSAIKSLVAAYPFMQDRHKDLVRIKTSRL